MYFSLFCSIAVLDAVVSRGDAVSAMECEIKGLAGGKSYGESDFFSSIVRIAWTSQHSASVAQPHSVDQGVVIVVRVHRNGGGDVSGVGS